MFSRQIDADPYHYFVTDDREGYAVLFIRKGMTGTREAPFEPHWVGRCGDKHTWEAMTHWVNARRNQWQDWGKLVETIGHASFARHMHDLLQLDPLELPEGLIIARGDDPRDFVLGHTLNGPKGLRNEVLYVHRFESAIASQKFAELCLRRREIPQILLETGWSKGANAVSAMIEQLASDDSRSPRRRSNIRHAA